MKMKNNNYENTSMSRDGLEYLVHGPSTIRSTDDSQKNRPSTTPTDHPKKENKQGGLKEGEKQ